MPTYDLVCADCGSEFSVFCSISKKDEQRCPECDSPNLKTRFTKVNILVGAKSGGPVSSPTSKGFS